MAAAMTVRTGPKKRHSSAWIFVPIATAFLIIAGIAIYGAISPYNFHKNPAPPGARGSLVWGDGIFSNKAQLKAWLSIHGGSYAKWAKTHPRALVLVKPRPKHRAVLAKAKVNKTTTPHKVAATAPRTAASPVAFVGAGSSSSQSVGIGIWLVVVLGLILGLLAAMPQRAYSQIGVRAGPYEREVRIAAVAAGAAVLLGVIAATIIS
jgi:hypothetical protein